MRIQGRIKLSKRIKDLPVGPNAVAPRTKGRGKLHDIGLGNDFSHMTPKEQVRKAEIDTWDCIRLKSRLCIKGHNQQTEKATGENIFK